jgi:PmbA protein
MSTEDIKEHYRGFIGEILKAEPDAKISMDYRKGEVTVHLANTSGLDVAYRRTFTSIHAQIFLISNGSFAWILRHKVSTKRTGFSKAEIKEIIREIDYSRKIVPVESGEMSAIFMPFAMVIPLKALSLGINGKMVQKGTTPIKGKTGKKILDKRITIYDDPLLENGIRSRPCDDEGVPSRRVPIFKNGVLKNFLFDLQTAGILGKESTASASRSFDEIPQPDHSNLTVSPGKWSVADMIRDIKNGIVVHHVIGGGQSNMIAGDFSFNVSMGFRIKNGKIMGRVKNTMIAGNAYEIMNNIEGIGKKVENIGSVYTPAFYFKKMNVVSR